MRVIRTIAASGAIRRVPGARRLVLLGRDRVEPGTASGLFRGGPYPVLLMPAPRSILGKQDYTEYAILGKELGVSVRHSLLALLEQGPMYGYGLKDEFEAATGQMWPLNVGQVYTTLARLERDGLVEANVEADDQKVYRLTDTGREELERWFSGPVSRGAVPR